MKKIDAQRENTFSTGRKWHGWDYGPGLSSDCDAPLRDFFFSLTAMHWMCNTHHKAYHPCAQRLWHGDYIWEAFRDGLSRGFQTMLLSLMSFPVLYEATLKVWLHRNNYTFGLKSTVSVRR